MQKTKQWEYRIRYYEIETSDHKSVDRLNNWGEYGWELVATNSSASIVKCWLKRELIDE